MLGRDAAAQGADVVLHDIKKYVDALAPAIRTLAPYTDFIVCGVPADDTDDGGLAATVVGLQTIEGCSFALVRANPDRALDFGIQSA